MSAKQKKVSEYTPPDSDYTPDGEYTPDNEYKNNKSRGEGFLNFGSKRGKKNAGRRSTHKKRRRRRNNAPRRNESKRIIPKIVVRNPTRKIASMFKKPNIFNEGYLAPPKAPKKNKTPKAKTSKTEEDKILASFSLPSSSAPRISNKDINIIGSINIQAFGTKKFSNQTIMRFIVDILRRYDIVFCQEIHVPKGKESMISQLADLISTSSTPYSFVLSEPVGKSSSRAYHERYLYLYRRNEWKVLESFEVPDRRDKFMRDPYVARFQHLKKPNVRVTLVGCHTHPGDVYNEIKALVTDVYPSMRKKFKKDTRETRARGTGGSYSFLWRYLGRCFKRFDVDTNEENTRSATSGNEPIVLMGDFNASGSYLNKKELVKLDGLLLKHNLVWGINRSTDTTVAIADDAYDRFIFEEASKRRWIGQTRVFRFDDPWIKKSRDEKMVKNPVTNEGLYTPTLK
ncbi:17156_t:CDS:2 [Gigaspora rosea]|nr:17156_t:CDS:2 [Gigaspora rosea]